MRILYHKRVLLRGCDLLHFLRKGSVMSKSKVFFTTMRTAASDSIPAKLRRLMKTADITQLDLEGALAAIKVHFGEFGNVSYLKPAYARTVCETLKESGANPFVTDCNTLYPGMRSNAINHLKCAELNGFNSQSCGCPTIIADGLYGGDEVELPTPEGSELDVAYIGRAICDADVLIALSHAKGCPASSYAGTLKNLAMGCASRRGKMIMHCAGRPFVMDALCVGCGRCPEGCGQDALHVIDGKATINDNCVGCGHCVAYCPRAAIGGDSSNGEDLQRKIAEYAGAVVQAKQAFFIVIAIDVTPACDCFAGNDAPMVPNIGMFASFDPVALDQVVADKICEQPEILSGPLPELHEACGEDVDHLRAINPDSDWRLCLEHAEQLGIGTRAYDLVEVR